MYLLDILGILKRSKERIQLRARLYYSSEYPFFVLNAFLENRGTFKFQVPNQTPLRKWLAKKWYRWSCSNAVQQFDDTNLFPPVWVILGLALCVVGFFCCWFFFFFSQSSKNSENFRTFFFFCGNKLFPILFSFLFFFSPSCGKEHQRGKKNKRTQLTILAACRFLDIM